MLKLCTIIFDDPERDTRVVAYSDRYAAGVGIKVGVIRATTGGLDRLVADAVKAGKIRIVESVRLRPTEHA